MGARPGDLEAIGENAKQWLIDQLQGPSRTPGPIANIPATNQILAEVMEARKKQREMKNAMEDGEDVRKLYANKVRRLYMDQVEARFVNAARTDYPFHERLVHFWANHFAVSADKQPIPAIVGSFEKEVIRANLGGKFSDMLVAVEKHPAMILYLDNQRSIGPNSEFSKRGRRKRKNRSIGLNENLAREIFELHTLGVDAGYTQNDVTAFAKVLTGWSLGINEGRYKHGVPGNFTFHDPWHEPGSKVIMAQRYNQYGVEQGEAVLKALATHRNTADHIAEKLVRHFVADDPPVAMVEMISQKFQQSGGDLPTVHRALVEAEQPWQNKLSKYKTPEEFMISTYRAFNTEPKNIRTLLNSLEQMGQATFKPGSPAGWPDTADYWGGADALYKRIEWAGGAGRFVGKAVNPLKLGEDVLGAAFGDHTRTAVARAESKAQGTTLLLVSADFQRR
jgi:uncharacterized protein (DUF1800 family)